jgi:Tol biopolymer transport system component
VVRFVPGARPDWSRNRTRIAFDRKSGARRELYVAGANGKQLRRLTGGLRDSWRPRWRR